MSPQLRQSIEELLEIAPPWQLISWLEENEVLREPILRQWERITQCLTPEQVQQFARFSGLMLGMGGGIALNTNRNSILREQPELLGLYGLVGTLSMAANSSGAHLAIALAKNPSTPANLLEILGQTHNPQTDSGAAIAAAVAGNLNAPPSLLETIERTYREVEVSGTTPKAGTYYSKVRFAIANNPATPEEERLAYLRECVAKNSYGEAIAKSPNTPTSILEQLVEQRLAWYAEKTKDTSPTRRTGSAFSTSSALGGSIEQAIADNPNAPVSALIEAARSTISDTLKGLAKNPNTPPELLEEIALNGEISARDAMLSALEPLRADRIQLENVLARAVTQIRDRDKLADLLKHPVKGSQMPAETLEQLTSHKYCVVRSRVARHRNTPSSALRLLANDDYSATRCAVSENSNTPTDVLESVLRQTKPDDSLYSTICHHLYNTSLTPELWRRLAADEVKSVRGAIANFARSPIAVLETIARDEDIEIRHKVAANANTPPRVLETLSQDAALVVRATVAAKANTPENILERLASDEKIEVRRAVAENPATPTPVIESLRDLQPQLLQPQLSQTLRGLGRLYNPETDDLPSLLSEYARRPKPFVRFVALMHPLTPAEVLEEGSQSLWWWERYAVADNPGTPTEIREQLAGDSDRTVRATAKANLSNYS